MPAQRVDARLLLASFLLITVSMSACISTTPPPALVMLPSERDGSASQYVAVTSLEMGTKTVYPFVPNAEPKNYGLFVKFQNVSSEEINVKVLVAPPLSSLTTCNLEVSISPGAEGGTICMQSAPVPNEDYLLQARVYSTSGELLESLEFTARFSEKDVAAFVGSAEGE